MHQWKSEAAAPYTKYGVNFATVIDRASGDNIPSYVYRMERQPFLFSVFVTNLDKFGEADAAAAEMIALPEGDGPKRMMMTVECPDGLDSVTDSTLR